MPEYKLFLVCRNVEREGQLRKALAEAAASTGLAANLVGIFRSAESAGDFLALFGAAKPQALWVDSSVAPEEALGMVLAAREKMPRVVSLIGIAEKDFDFLQKAVSSGVDAVLPEPVEASKLLERVRDVLQDRISSREKLEQSFAGAGAGGAALLQRMKGQEGAQALNLSQPLKELTEQLRGGNATTLAFLSSKDGEGRSTVALNLGLSLARKFNKKVIYLDLSEVLSETAMMLNRKPPGTLLNVLAMKSGEFTEHGVKRFAIDYFEDESFLAICGNPTIEAPTLDRDALDLLIRFLKSQCSFLLLDCPVRFDVPLKTALKLSDWHVMVVQNTLSSLRNTRIYLEELRRLEYPSHQVRIVLNRVSRTAGLAREDIEKHINPYPVVTSIVSNGPVAIEAITVGVPVVEHAPDSDLAESIHTFSKRLLGIEATNVGENQKFSLGSMISSFFKGD